jgi:Flp pilus assembly protein TadG
VTAAPARRKLAQSVVEFALVVPLFFFLLFGLIGFARLLFTYTSLSNGAREMARVAAVSNNWTPASNATGLSAITAFNNYVVIAGGTNAATDSVTVLTADATCARQLDTGSSSCSSGVSTTYGPCVLPLVSASCTLGQPPQDGFVQVAVSYTFQFNPLFENRLSGITDVSFMRPSIVLTTTARAYAE